MNSRNRNTNYNLRMIAGIGIFAALAIVVSFATSFLKIGYLSIDAGDIIIVLASFIYGPVSAVVISLISSAVGMAYSGTMFWGAFMDFCSSATFALTASLIYSYRKNFASAIVGIYSAVVVVCAVMMPLNILITPLYIPYATAEFVISEIPRLLLPFNLVKALFNGGAVLLLYKPIVRAMRKAKLAPLGRNSAVTNGKTDSAQGHKNLFSLFIGGVTLLVAILAFVIMKIFIG